MTDGDETPVVRDSTPSRRDWRFKVRWFTAEYLIIVLGVLTAIGMDAAWQARQDRTEEQVYLRQLAQDLRVTLRLVAQADSSLAEEDRMGAQLLHTYVLTERPPDDSLVLWFRRAFWYLTPRPVTSTADALVATGDLGLIRDDTLPTAITAYLERMRNDVQSQEALTERFGEAAGALYDRFDPNAVFVRVNPPAVVDSVARADPLSWLPDRPRRDPPPIDFDALLAREGTRALLWRMNLAKRNLRALRQEIGAASSELLERVEAQIVSRAAEPAAVQADTTLLRLASPKR